MAFFELNDIKRDRMPYKSDLLWHLPVWSPLITNSMESNLKKAMVGTVMATLIVEPVNHIWNSMKTLNLVYEWPRNSSELSIFLKETFKVPQFWAGLRKKVVFGSLQWTMDYGLRIAAHKKIWGGTWSPIAFNDFNIVKYILFCWMSALPSCWVGIPFDTARRAYYADLTWPAELRKGYRSPLHALASIPFKEGPLYLFKGGLLTYIGNVQITAFTFLFYDWLKNKLFILWVYNEVPYSLVKFCCLNAAFAAGVYFGYPFIGVKNMMDNWPKERGGRDTFQGSAWNAYKFTRSNFEGYSTTFYNGYWKWFRTQGIIFWLAIWHADNLGLFTNYRSDFNTIHNIVSYGESD